MVFPKSYLTYIFLVYIALGILVGLLFTLVVPLIIPIPDELMSFFAGMSITAGLLLGCLNYYVCYAFIKFCISKFREVLTKVREGDLNARISYEGTGVIGKFANELNFTIGELERKDILAKSDMLTGLPNRVALDEYFFQLEQENQHQTLYFIDLDRFKEINDNYGHAVGDEVLKEVADRLRSFDENTQSTSYRFGGDEFVIITDTYSSAYELQNALLPIFSAPLNIAGGKIILSWSIGSHTFTSGYVNYEEIIKKADISMYENKSKNR